MGLALANGSAVFLTQMLRVPLKRLTKAMNVPSGEVCAPAISGSPKKISRSIIGGACAQAGAARGTKNKAERISRPIIERRESKTTSVVVGMVDKSRHLGEMNSGVRSRELGGFNQYRLGIDFSSLTGAPIQSII